MEVNHVGGTSSHTSWKLRTRLDWRGDVYSARLSSIKTLFRSKLFSLPGLCITVTLSVVAPTPPLSVFSSIENWNHYILCSTRGSVLRFSLSLLRPLNIWGSFNWHTAPIQIVLPLPHPVRFDPSSRSLIASVRSCRRSHRPATPPNNGYTRLLCMCACVRVCMCVRVCCFAVQVLCEQVTTLHWCK